MAQFIKEGRSVDEAPQREMTFGEKAVGLTFNPSGDPRVNEVKKLYAEIIDLLKHHMNPQGGEINRMLAIAITESQTAQMWAVKAITWRY